MRSVFREYDIRGLVDRALTPDLVLRIGQAIGTLAAERGERKVAVGCDGRLSSPSLCAALKTGLKAAGRDVIDVGRVPTPVLYYATQVLDTRAGVMVTGSHNPPEYNGLKVVLDGIALHGEVIREIYTRVQQGPLCRGRGGEERLELRDEYVEFIGNALPLQRPFKVVVDCGNAIAGELAPELLGNLGCTVVPLHCEVDGRFPHHHPDPSVPENLAELCVRVQSERAELGLAFDGDADRLGVVTDKGEIIWPDRVMMPMAADVLALNPGASIIYDVKCSNRLPRLIERLGGRPIMSRTGHSLIKAKMRETGALLGGEMTGHFAYADFWFGFDDGLYAAARLLRILSADGRPVSAQFEDYPVGVNTPELRIGMAEGEPFTFMERLGAQVDFDDKVLGPAKVSTLDGLRVEYPHGWGLVRASNTTPSLVLRFEADDRETLEAIQALFRRRLRALQADLSIPF